MKTRHSGVRRALVVACVAAVAACASAPDREALKARQKVADEQVAAILAAPPEEGGEAAAPERCLRSTDWRNYRALDDRYLLFEGTRDRLWLNTLPMRCPDLRFSSVLTVRSIGSINRMCQSDTFRAGDWFDMPWFRRWPWQWTQPWHTGAVCVLGPFRRINARQLDAIEEALDYRR